MPKTAVIAFNGMGRSVDSSYDHHGERIVKLKNGQVAIEGSDLDW